MDEKSLIDTLNGIQIKTDMRKRLADWIVDRTGDNRRRKIHSIRPAAVFASAAVLCAAILGGLLLPIRDGNSFNVDGYFFTVKAYALGQQTDDSTELSGADLVEQPDTWGGYFDGETLYVGIGLKCEGEGIESVEFFASEGFFATQIIGSAADGESVPKMGVGDRLLMYGFEFEVIGDRITLDSDTVYDNLLIFWGKNYSTEEYWSNRPKEIIVRAIATFSNGETSEQMVTIDLSGHGTMSIADGAAIPELEELREQQEAQREYFENIPLDNCELIPESVEVFTDVYEYTIGDGSGGWFHTPPDDSEIPFDASGIFRSSYGQAFDGSGYIVVIKRNSDGTFTGMQYIVPMP